MRRTILVLLVLAAAIVAAQGCGGGDATESAKAIPPEAVVRAWADDLRRGDVDAASALFAVPALVANGTPLIRLDTKEAVRFFNMTLPCGGRVTSTERKGNAIVATFVLTDRPGGDCGDGAGNEAKAAFEVRDGKIVRWVRVDGDAPSGPVV